MVSTLPYLIVYQVISFNKKRFILDINIDKCTMFFFSEIAMLENIFYHCQ